MPGKLQFTLQSMRQQVLSGYSRDEKKQLQPWKINSFSW
jgi:hypothetical protein